MNEAVNSLSLSHSRAMETGRLLSRLQTMYNSWKNWRVPGTAGSCFTNNSDKNGESPIQRASVQHRADRQVRMEKKASCFTLLKRITRLKCVNSEIKSNVESCCLARHSPKGSYHLVEPAGRTHLYRKAIRICNVRAKNKQNRHDETNEYIYIYKSQWTLTV